MFKVSSFFLLLLLLVCSGTYSAFADSQSIPSDLTQAASEVLDFPGGLCNLYPLKFLHGSIVQNYALLSWQCGEGGGGMLLRRQDDSWQMIGNDGGAYASTQLVELGVPEDTAVQLIREFQAQWPEVTTDETP